MKGDVAVAESCAREALEAGMPALRTVEDGFSPGIRELGSLFEEGESFLPELVMGAEAMKAGLAVLRPQMISEGSERSSLGRAVIGTIQGDIHDIGKSLVATMLEASGFEVTDLGADVYFDGFVQAAKDQSAHLVCVSALLTTTMIGVKGVIEALKREGIRDSVKVLVGGAPVTESWALEMGADAYGSDALDGVRAAKRLLA
jgi:corrinoid protein of di/trimethylamine methyltransferase